MFRIEITAFSGETFKGYRTSREGAERFANAVNRLLREEGVGDSVEGVVVINEDAPPDLVDMTIYKPKGEALVVAARSRGDLKL